MGPVKSHLDNFSITPNDNMMKMIGKCQDLPKLFTFEALSICEINPCLNTKDEI